MRRDRAACGRNFPAPESARRRAENQTEKIMNADQRSYRMICFLPLLLALAACGQAKVASYQGYVEGDYVLIASPYAGSLQALNVTRGQTVESGTALFTLEQQNEAAE